MAPSGARRAVSGARPRQRDAGRADFHVGAAEQRAAPPGLGPGAVHRSRAPAPANYPQSEFPEPLSWLEDEERRAAFDDSGNHFESGYHLTLVNLPAEESRARAAGLLYENRPTEGVDWRERLTAFVVETDRIFDLLDGVMPEIAWLDDSQTLTYLHATVSTRRYREGVPEVPFHLDALLADAPLIGGLAPMLGDQHARGDGAGISDLHLARDSGRPQPPRLCVPLEYALSLPRQIRCGKELARLRRQWVAKRKNIIALLRETIFQQESALVDTDASNKASDADAALQELGSDQVAFGYVTATVTVLDADAAVADEKLRRVERVTQGVASSPSLKRSTPWMRGCRPFRAMPAPTSASPSSPR